MNSQAKHQRVIELTSLLADGRLPATQHQQLNSLLRADPEACEVYLDVMATHSHLLQQSESAAVDAGLEFLRQSDPKNSKVPAAPNKPWLTVLIPLALAASLLFVVIQRQPDEPVATTGSPDQASQPTQTTATATADVNSAGRPELSQTPGGVAVLSHVVSPRWSETAPHPSEGDTLAPGRLTLVSGLVQLDFFSGASLIAEGPADLQLDSAWLARCNRGKIRVCVPNAAHGFTIETANYRAVDLGTEFAMRVGDGASEVHVIDGQVRIDDYTGQEIDNLTTGNGIRVQGDSAREIESNTDDFVGREAMMHRSNHQSINQLVQWRDLQDALSKDPNLIVQFDFENQNPWDYQLSNQASGGSDGAIIGARWTEGRWPEKKALEFKRITDRVRVNIPGEFDQLTLAAWVRVEGFGQWLSSLILTDGFEEGEVHWQIADDGGLILGIGRSVPLSTYTPPVIKPSHLGRWCHLAVTIDRSTRQVIHYLDGKEISRETKLVIPPLKLGDAEVGNWVAQSKSHAIRSFNGRMDEFLIFDRVLSPEEIVKLNVKLEQ